MKLTDYEKEMLNGDHGEVRQQAMQVLYDLAAFHDVDRFVEIVGCHDDSTVYAGEAQVAFAEMLAEKGARFAVPTTTNATACDMLKWHRQKHDVEVMSATRRIEASHIKMGAIPTWSCAPYQAGFQPSFGQQLACAESNVICYYNSIIGARTNRYAGPLELLCGIAGRVPYFGLHVPENRYAQGLVKLGDDIRLEYFEDESMYPLVSYAFGSIVGDRIWALEGMPTNITNDNLKQRSATAASSGGIALFHMIGVTPEAQTREMAFGGKKPEEVVEIHIKDLEEAERQLTNYEVDGDIDIVLLGCPHFSYDECAKLEFLMNGRKVSDSTELWIIVGRATVDRLKDSGLYERLTALGIQIYSDGCILEYRSQKLGTKTIMSNSGKFDTYCFSMRGIQPVFGNMWECVETAVAGKIVKGARPWKK